MILSNPTTEPVVLSGVSLMGANPPVVIVAISKATSMTAMVMVITGQNVGSDFFTSSVVGGLRLLIVFRTLFAMRPTRPFLLCIDADGGLVGGV